MRLIYVLLLLFSNPSLAGIFEIDANTSYRKSTVDDINWEEKKELGFSISYYFWAQSAIELSATTRLTIANIGSKNTSGTILSQTELQTEETLYGADFVWSLADMKASTRPYIKVGAVFIHKKSIQQELLPSPSAAISTPFKDGLAPSAGIGIKIGLTETMGIKIGLEAWNVELYDNKKQYDYAGRAGLSWMF